MGSPKDTPIHVAFCVNDPYVKYICVTIKSIVKNHPGREIVVHVLTDHLSASNKRRLCRAASPAVCIVHPIDDIRINDLRTNGYTKYAWYRIFLPEVLGDDIHRVLYLDADTIVHADLSELYELDMHDRSVAVVPDDWNDFQKPEFFSNIGVRDHNRYFCSGVMLLNLDYWREHNLTGKVLDWASQNADKLTMPDQDTLNFVCQDSSIMLPRSYDVTFYQLTDRHFLDDLHNVAVEGITHPRIIHYCAQCPWHLESRHPLTYIWHQYNRQLGIDRVFARNKERMSLLMRIKTHLWHILHPSFFEDLYQQTLKIINMSGK